MRQYKWSLTWWTRSHESKHALIIPHRWPLVYLSAPWLLLDGKRAHAAPFIPWLCLFLWLIAVLRAA